MLSLLLAFCWCNRLDALVSFSRVSSMCSLGSSLRFPRVALGNSAGCVAVAWRHGKSCIGGCLMRVLRCYGFGLLQMVGFKVRVQRAGLQVSLARVGGRSCEFRSTRELQEMFKPCSRESERERAHSRVVLNCPSLDIAHRRLVQSERRYGAEPRLHGWVLQGTFMWRK